MNSETPRTDAQAGYGWSGDAICVSADFARELERELNDCIETKDRVAEQRDKLEAECDQLKTEVQQLGNNYNSVNEAVIEAIKDRDCWREMAQKAYEVCIEVAAYGSCDCNFPHDEKCVVCTAEELVRSFAALEKGELTAKSGKDGGE